MNFVISAPSTRLPRPLSQQEPRIVKGAVTVDFTTVFHQVELCLTAVFIPAIANMIAKYATAEFKTGTRRAQAVPLDLTFASVSFDAAQLPSQGWTLQPYLTECLAEYWAAPPLPSLEHATAPQRSAVEQIQGRGTYTDFMDKVHEIRNDQLETILVTRRGFVARATGDSLPPPPADNTTIGGCLLVADRKEMRTVFETMKELKSKDTMLMIAAPRIFGHLNRDVNLFLPGWNVRYAHDLTSFGELIESLTTIDLVVLSQAVVATMIESLADDQPQPWMFDAGGDIPEPSSSTLLSRKIVADNIMWDTLIIDDVDDFVPRKNYKRKTNKHYLGRDAINLRNLFSSKRTILLSTKRSNLQSPEHLDTYIYLLGSTTCDGASLFPPHHEYHGCSKKKMLSFQLPSLQRTKLHHLFLNHHVATTTCRGQKRKEFGSTDNSKCVVVVAAQ
jgi:hypothetical protein